MSSHNQSIGKWGEDMALDFLINLGYKLLARNERNQIGEIDLVMELNQIIIFIEVKTRTNIEFGFPEEAISPSKFQRMFDCASMYLAEKRPDFDGDWQIDLVSIVGKMKSQYPEIIHLPAL